MVTKNLGEGTVVFREGEPAEEAYLIEDGAVDILQGQGPERRLLARLGPGEVFGEMGVIDGTPRSTWAVAAAPLRLVPVGADKIRQSIARADPFFAELTRKMVGRLRHSRDEIGVPDRAMEIQSSGIGPGYEEVLRERDIAEGIIRGEIEPYIQPIVQLVDGKVVGYEALARRRSEAYGLMTPTDFMPLARRTGLIRRIDLTMADRALGLCAAMGMGEDAPFIAVNVSAWHLRDRTLVESLKRMLAQHGLPPQRVCVEINESMLIDDAADADSLLHELHESGVRIALDDFGTGFSPLSFLYRLPIDILKIDGTMAEGAESSPRRRAVLEGLRDLCARLGIDIIVEGIETEETAAALVRLGFPLGQGTRFAAPAAPDLPTARPNLSSART